MLTCYSPGIRWVFSIILYCQLNMLIVYNVNRRLIKNLKIWPNLKQSVNNIADAIITG